MKYINICRHSFSQNTSVYTEYLCWFCGHFVNCISNCEDFFIPYIICEEFWECTINSRVVFAACRINSIRDQICTVVFQEVQHIVFGSNRVQHSNITVLCKKNIIKRFIRIVVEDSAYFSNRFSCIWCILLSMQCACVNSLKASQFYNIFKDV